MTSHYEWTQYVISVTVSQYVARELIRAQQTLLYDSNWLCGKPVGGTARRDDPGVDVDVLGRSRGARKPLRKKGRLEGVPVDPPRRHASHFCDGCEF